MYFIIPNFGYTAGSPIYENGALDQYLNTTLEGGQYYQPQTPFSNVRSWLNTKDGFMRGFEEDFISGLADTTFSVIPGYYPINNTTLTRKFFIPSLNELSAHTSTISSLAKLDYPWEYYIQHSSNSDRVKRELNTAVRYHTRNNMSYNSYTNALYRIHTTGAPVSATIAHDSHVIPACMIGQTDNLSRGLMYESQVLADDGRATISGDMNGITLYFECIGKPDWVSLSIPNNEVVLDQNELFNLIYNEEQEEETSTIIFSNLLFNQNQKNTVILTVHKHICTIYVNGQKFTSNNYSQIPLTFTSLYTGSQIQNVKIWNRDLSNYEKQLLLPVVEDVPILPAVITISEPVLHISYTGGGLEEYDLNSICSVSPSTYSLNYTITSSDNPNAMYITNGILYLDKMALNESSGGLTIRVSTLPVSTTQSNITVYYDYNSCLTEDTLITMLDGTQKQIKDVKIGETVKSINQTTGEYEMGIVRYNRGLSNITYDNYDLWTFENGTTIKTMTGHRLYNIEKKAYVYLNEWNIGDHVLFADGTISKLVSHENIKQNVVAYSLIIDQQTYIANGMITGTRRAKPITPFSQYNGVIE